MFKWLVLWFSFSGALFFNDYKVPESAILEEHGRVSKLPLRAKQPYVLTSWNVYKGNIAGMTSDLAQLINESDFVHIQEFSLDDHQKKQIDDFSTFRWIFAKSFQDKKDWAGVVLVSRWQPYESAPIRTVDAEMLSKTPKMSLITKFKMEEGPELWLANIDGLSFNLSRTAFQRQINAVVAALANHDGPIIFSGDFKTWTETRRNYLLSKTAELGLTHAELDSPVGFMGTTLDHIFYRGLNNVKVSVLSNYNTSDHLPLRIEFSL